LTERLSDRIRRLQGEGLMPVLAEIKLRSPKEGDLLRGRSPQELARAMDARPIAGLSVVTEPQDFGGSLELLRGLARVVDAPILRKDFVRGPGEVRETVDAGASALLLTVSLLEDPLLSELHAAARASGLETLVETHDRDEIDRVVSLGLEPDVLGINNRDILVLETDDGDVSQTEGLASLAPPGWLVLSESAIQGPADASRARDAGADAVLVGTAILQAEDPAAAIDALVGIGWRDVPKKPP
jgi:indole-3-glycerol phosphate synthase